MDRIEGRDHEVVPSSQARRVVDNVRVLLGFLPRQRPDGPTFFQYLLPPALRATSLGTPHRLFDFLRDSGWSALRAGKIYRDHGWHPAFNAHDRFFLVVSVNDFHDRFPLPLAWVVPVVLAEEGDSGWGRLPIDVVQTKLPGRPLLYADTDRIHSVEASQQWFLPCHECRYAYRDAQSWLIPESSGRRTCVRCDGARAQWPEEVATLSLRSLADVRARVAAYLGVSDEF